MRMRNRPPVPWRRLGRAVTVGGCAAALALAVASPAAAELAEPPGACAGTGTWNGGGFTVDSAVADPAGVIEIPRADSVAWTGQANGPQPGDPRPIAGSIALRLPPPLGWATVDDWDGTGVNVAAAGVQSYDLPGVVPAGVVFQLRAEHHENGGRFCSGTAQLRIAGGPFDSPLLWVALAGTVLLAGLLLLTGRAPAGGRRIARSLTGALLGLLLGAFLGLTLLLLGALSLASPVLSLAPIAGLAAGGAWGRWAPLGGAVR